MGFILNDKKTKLAFEEYRTLPSLWDSATARDIVNLLDQWFDPSRDFLEFRSSGSTAASKSIAHSKEAIKASALRTQAFFDYKTGDHSLLALPVRYVAGSMMLLRSVISQLELGLEIPSSNPLINVSYNIDFIAITPHQLIGCLKYAPSKSYRIPCILLGGSPVPEFLEEQLQDWPGAVYLGYGMTETLTHVAVRRIDGKAYQDVYTRISDDIVFDIDKDSRLLIKMPFTDGWIQTNDVVELKGADSFIWLGRDDFMINSGGLKINPQTIESVFARRIKAGLFVSHSQHSELGQRPVLWVESAYSPELLKEIKELNSQLDSIFKLDKVYFLPRFNYTGSGKLDRRRTSAAVDMAEMIQL